MKAVKRPEGGGSLPVFLLSLALLLAGSSCSNRSAIPFNPVLATQASNGLILIQESDSHAIWAAQTDRQTARDILAALQANSEQICADLQTKCRFPVLVEVYPDQASFDKHVMNPEMRGFFAISGFPHTIQMVSPANPAPHQVSYEEGVSVAVHEFVHLALDEVNDELPIWLDEGTAVYLAPHRRYTRVCEQAFPFELVPSFRQLEEDYEDIQAADLFAYTAVDFIVSRYGMETLNSLLHTPQDLEQILGLSQEEFEESWLRFMRTHYHNHSAKASFDS
ncbi:MAG: hypothetical protein ACM3XO_05395 [Bacteroidota bacterium]